mmetsp:Transcript_10813/g.37678  ORF Transcript_10813/g.37678 Transcript_10813/m.37678 type:complete len:280 (-) Transcript_10813:525-1364(-)
MYNRPTVATGRAPILLVVYYRHGGRAVWRLPPVWCHSQPPRVRVHHVVTVLQSSESAARSGRGLSRAKSRCVRALAQPLHTTKYVLVVASHTPGLRRKNRSNAARRITSITLASTARRPATWFVPATSAVTSATNAPSDSSAGPLRGIALAADGGRMPVCLITRSKRTLPLSMSSAKAAGSWASQTYSPSATSLRSQSSSSCVFWLVLKRLSTELAANTCHIVPSSRRLIMRVMRSSTSVPSSSHRNSRRRMVTTTTSVTATTSATSLAPVSTRPLSPK